jgi:hypothetical protein
MLSIYVSEGASSQLSFCLCLTCPVVMCIRTWALWRCDRRIAVLLALIMAGGIISHCVVMANFNASLKSEIILQASSGILSFLVLPPPFEGFRGCFVAGANNMLGYNYVIWTSIEAGAYSQFLLGVF